MPMGDLAVLNRRQMRRVLLLLLLALAAVTARAARRGRPQRATRAPPAPDVSFRAADGTKLVGQSSAPGEGRDPRPPVAEQPLRLGHVRAQARTARLHGVRDRLPRPRSLAAPQARPRNRLAPRPRRGRQGHAPARQDEGLPRRRLDGRDRGARRRREREAGRRRGRQRLRTRPLPRPGRGRDGAAAPRARALPRRRRTTTTPATTSRRTRRRCTRPRPRPTSESSSCRAPFTAWRSSAAPLGRGR